MRSIHRSVLSVASVVLASVAFVGCTTTRPGDASSSASSRASMEAQVDATLSKLYASVPGSREMVAKANGVLVFPAVVGASF